MFISIFLTSKETAFSQEYEKRKIDQKQCYYLKISGSDKAKIPIESNCKFILGYIFIEKRQYNNSDERTNFNDINGIYNKLLQKVLKLKSV